MGGELASPAPAAAAPATSRRSAGARPRPRAGARLARRSGFWACNFVRESIGELRKVEWPGQSQVIQGTVVVIIACVIIGAYLYLLRPGLQQARQQGPLGSKRKRAECSSGT
jgi:preprotein translocase SecE subunit